MPARRPRRWGKSISRETNSATLPTSSHVIYAGTIGEPEQTPVLLYEVAVLRPRACTADTLPDRPPLLVPVDAAGERDRGPVERLDCRRPEVFPGRRHGGRLPGAEGAGPGW